MWIWPRKSKSSGNNSVAFSGLPTLPNDVDDNMYLASAANAAVTDRKSGAYDEFLFSEHGMQAMPFEESVDNHLGLVRLRLADKGRRELFLKRQALLVAKARLSKSKASQQTLAERLKAIRGRLSQQLAVLAGKEPGKQGLYWPGSEPEITSSRSARLAIAKPVLLFLVVGLVDIYIIILSLQSLDGFDGFEPYVFSLPAVGVQLVFPHFIGNRINLNMHNHAKKLSNTVEICLLALGWIAFVVAMSQIRMAYISKTVMDAGGSLTPLMRVALVAMVILMLVGLGTWLILTAARSNPHEHEIGKLKLAEILALKKLQKATELNTSLEAEIPILELAVKVAEESYRDAVEATGNKLRDAAKSVYRRALVNQYGSVDFTTAYLADADTFVQSVDEEIRPSRDMGA